MNERRGVPKGLFESKPEIEDETQNLNTSVIETELRLRLENIDSAIAKLEEAQSVSQDLLQLEVSI